MKQLPNLLKQETSSLHASLGVLYRMYDDKTRQEDWGDVEMRLFRFANQIMSSFLLLQVCVTNCLSNKHKWLQKESNVFYSR